MIPTFMGLQTALSGLEAAQAAINTTGQNIANANTPGYSRQTVNLTERGALTIPSVSAYNGHGIQLGTGMIREIIDSAIGAILLLVVIKLIRGGGRW